MPEDVLADLERHGLGPAGEASEAARAVAGGSIHRTVRLATRAGPVFLKLAGPERFDLLAAEADGLAALAATRALAVPGVAVLGRSGSAAYLALEWLDLGGGSERAERALGRGLARLHRQSADAFGWQRDNYIGATPQPNARARSWTRFFAERRLGHQLELAARAGLPRNVVRCGERLAAGIDRFFETEPAPSLLHGDLWGGNWGASSGVPYVFDPAVYYGDREADLAMTRLFGGFGAAFYEAYAQSWPLEPGWRRRVALYNLYHLLNHFNLFGGAYSSQVVAALERLAGAAAASGPSR